MECLHYPVECCVWYAPIVGVVRRVGGYGLAVGAVRRVGGYAQAVGKVGCSSSGNDW